MEHNKYELNKQMKIRRQQLKQKIINSSMKKRNEYVDKEQETQTDAYEFQHMKNPHTFFMKCLVSAALVLIIAIAQNHSFPYKEMAMKQIQSEFQFATIANWYETTFSKSFAFVKKNEGPNESLSVPVSGQLLTSYSDSKTGVIIETSAQANVEAIQAGIVLFAGNNEESGQTIIIQHEDQTESIYGHLETIFVKPYEKINKGTSIGEVADGKFYFGFKKDGKLIDPLQVISFE